MRYRRDEGVALVIVLSVLAMLLVIATPFVLQAKKDYRSALTTSEEQRARRIAEAAIDWAGLELERTNQGLEKAGRGFATPYWDDPSELRVDAHPEHLFPFGSEQARYMGDPRGDLWAIHARDEQASINADTAPPFVWSGLLGRGYLTRDHDPSDTSLQVDSIAGFAKEKGAVIIGGRLVEYSKAEGQLLTGVKLDEGYPEGALVMNATAWDLALYGIRSPRAQQGITRLPALTSIKEVASYGRQALDEAELDRLIEPLTIHGLRDSVAGWLAPQNVIANIDPESYTPERGQPVRIANPDHFNCGTIIRIQDGVGEEYHVVREVRRRGSEGVLYLSDPISREYEWISTRVSARMRHAVNVNACSKEVLMLLLDGLARVPGSRRFAPSESRITPELAENIAEVIIGNRPIRGHEHLCELLRAMYLVKQGNFAGGGEIESSMVMIAGFDEVPMSADHVIAVAQNALNANHRELVSSTMPFRYTSGDLFTVEAAASVNDGGGSELARHRLRQTFRSAPRDELRFRLDSQLEFEQPIIATRSGRFVQTHPEPTARFLNENARPEPRLLRYLDSLEDPDATGIYPSREEGDLRLQPARLYGGWTEHFDGDVTGSIARGVPGRGTGVRAEDVLPEGYPLAGRPYFLNLGVSGQTGGNRRRTTNAATIADQRGLNPFAVDFYIRPQGWARGAGLFSAYGRDPQLDKIEAWYEPSDRTLRLKVHDITLDDPRWGRESAVEVEWNPTAPLEDDTWYHIGLHVPGTKPGEISLHVDGFERGDSKYVSRLSSSFNSTDDNFIVEDASDWPAQGAFLIGTEIVHAIRSGPNTYNVFQNPNPNTVLPGGRGVRGTAALDHQVGERVTIFGYSTIMRRFDEQAGEVLRTGGSVLESELRPFDYAGIIGTQTDTIQLPQGLTFGVEILDLPSAGQIQLRSFANGNLAQEQEAFQSGGGYAIIVAPEFPGDNQLDQVNDLDDWVIVQMIRYQARNNETLTGVTAVNDPFNPQLSDNLPLAGGVGGGGAGGVPGPTAPGAGGQGGLRFYSRQLRSIVTRLTGGGPQAPPTAFIFPISVELTGSQGYREPELNQGGTPQIEYLQLGDGLVVPDFRNFASHRIEWVAYTGVDRVNHSFIMNELSGLRNTCQQVTASLVVPGLRGTLMARVDPISINRLNWRTRAQTDQFGWTDPADATHYHNASSVALPTFRVEVIGFNAGASALGFGDAVTLMRADNFARELQYVSWAWGNRAALTSNVASIVSQIALPNISTSNSQNGSQVRDQRRYTRLCKFPSGEMPLITNQSEVQVGFVQGRSGNGIIDEIRLRSTALERFTLWDESLAAYGAGIAQSPYPIGISDQATDIPIVSSIWIPRMPNSTASSNGFVTANWLPDGRQLDLVDNLNALQGDAGLVKIDDEIIAFRSISQNGSGGTILTDCERGFMNTIARPHSFGARIVFLDFRTVTQLENQVQPDDADFVVTDASDFGLTDLRERAGGAFLVNNEMVHYTRVGANLLGMPRRLDVQSGEELGIFRGRYGTRRGSHGNGTIVLDMPFRYWDRHVRDSDDPELAFYEFSIDQARSFFKRLRWTTHFQKPRIGIEILCRFDPKVPWDTPPAVSGGKLVRFVSEPGQSLQRINRQLLNVNGRGVELRVFFTYEPNAFDPDDLRFNSWKETPRLLDIELRYLAAPWVMSREVLR